MQCKSRLESRADTHTLARLQVVLHIYSLIRNCKPCLCLLSTAAMYQGEHQQQMQAETRRQVAHLTGGTIKLDKAVPKLPLLLAHSLWLHLDLHQVREPLAGACAVTSWKAGPLGYLVVKLRPWWGGASHDPKAMPSLP